MKIIKVVIEKYIIFMLIYNFEIFDQKLFNLIIKKEKCYN